MLNIFAEIFQTIFAEIIQTIFAEKSATRVSMAPTPPEEARSPSAGLHQRRLHLESSPPALMSGVLVSWRISNIFEMSIIFHLPRYCHVGGDELWGETILELVKSGCHQGH